MLEIRWRPSGGRGEYEYLSSAHDMLGKNIVVRLPVLGGDIKTDVRFDFKDGKPRLRREDPNDRSLLNVPQLVAAIAGLPESRREDTEGSVSFPLKRKAWVIGTIAFDVVKVTENTAVLEPVLLQPLHALEAIDLKERLNGLIKAADSSDLIADFIEQLKTLENTSKLTRLATEVHDNTPLGIETIHRPEETDDIIADFAAKEGRWVIRTHRQKERNRKVVEIAKQRFRKKHGKLFCECCGLEFGSMYSPLGADFIEAHHKQPLETLKEEQETRPEDLTMVCPNCHRMIHRTDDCSVDAVKKVLKTNGAFINAANLKLLD